MGAGITIGLDFGTSTTYLGARRDGSSPAIMPIGEAASEMPSVAGYNHWGRLLTGERADRLPAARSIRSVKRQITARRDSVWVRRGDERVEVDVADVIGTILREAGERAGRRDVDLHAVDTLRLGCPAQWDAGQRRTLREIAALSGLGNAAPELVDEPVAAGISWVSNRSAAGHPPEGRLLVVDYGGGTLDVAVLDVAVVGGHPAITVMSTLGVHRAGDALDAAIVADLSADWRELGSDLAAAPRPEAAQALADQAARQAKVRLSREDETTVRVADGDWRLPEVRYSRSRLEARFTPLLDEALDLVDAALRGAALSEGRPGVDPAALRGDITHVLLAGGLSHVPLVRRRLAEAFPQAPIEADGALGSPAHSIAHGLSLSSSYERLSLHRPGLDLVLSWTDDDGHERVQTLYRAHTPLYERQHLAAGQRTPVLDVAVRDLGVTGPRPARVEAVAIDGVAVPLLTAGGVLDGLPVMVGPQAPVELAVHVDGQLVLRGSDGREQVLRVRRWPLLHRAGEALQVDVLTMDLTADPTDMTGPVAVVGDSPVASPA